MIPGMGVPTVTAARILKGQLGGRSGEETDLVMDTFPHLALSKVSVPPLTPAIAKGAYFDNSSVGFFLERSVDSLVFGSRRRTTWINKCQTAQARPRLTSAA